MSTSLSTTFRGRVGILWTIFFPIFMPCSRVHDFYLVGGGGGGRGGDHEVRAKGQR